MTTDLSQALADCLDAIEQTSAQLDDCLLRHPEQRAALSELLPVAAMLRSAPAVVPPLDFRMNARARLIARLPARRSRTQAWLDPVRAIPQSIALTLAWRSALSRVLISLLVVMVMGASVAYASAGALPNDALYPVKLSVEQIRLAFTANTRSQIELRLAFAAERLREIDRLLEAGRGSEAVVALNDFNREVRTAIGRAQAVLDTAERQALMVQIIGALDRYEAMLIGVEARLPDTAQATLQQTREEIQADLRQPAPSLPPTAAPMPKPTSTATSSPTVKPTRSRTPPAAHPTAVSTWWPTDFPVGVPTWVTPDATYIATYVPTQWGTLNPTVIATYVPTRWRTLVPTAWPTILPTQWRTLIPTAWPTAFPTINWPTPPAEPPETWPTFPPPEEWPTEPPDPPGGWPPG